RFDEAAQAYQRTYEIDLKYHEPESYLVLGDLSNWGSTLERAGRVHKARELLASALHGMENVPGKPRKIKVLTAGKLCGVEVTLDDLDAATRDCARLLQIQSETSGLDDATYADILRQEAARLLALGSLAESRKTIEHGLDLYGD